jgi:hypothetical protein
VLLENIWYCRLGRKTLGQELNGLNGGKGEKFELAKRKFQLLVTVFSTNVDFKHRKLLKIFLFILEYSVEL